MPLRHPCLLLLALLGFACASCSKKAPDPKLLYASAEASGEILVVDPGVTQIVARIPVGKRPRGLKVSRDGRLLYVALSGSPRGGPNVDESKLPPADRSADGIGVVDLNLRKLVRTFPSGQDPESFDLSSDGNTLYVSNEETAELSVLDLEKGTIVGKVPVGKEPEGVTLRPDGKIVYVTSEQDGSVAAVDTATLAVVATIPTGLRPRGIAFTKDGALGFVSNELGGTLTVFDARNNQPLSTIKVEPKAPPDAPPDLRRGGERPMGLAFSSDDKQLFVSTGRGGAVAVIDVAKRDFDRLIEGVGARPWGVALDAEGKHLYTANGSSDDLSVIDVATGKVEKRIKTGGLPWGVVTGATH
jgi:YVTN family beta-propeller protein